MFEVNIEDTTRWVTILIQCKWKKEEEEKKKTNWKTTQLLIRFQKFSSFLLNDNERINIYTKINSTYRHECTNWTKLIFYLLGLIERLFWIHVAIVVNDLHFTVEVFSVCDEKLSTNSKRYYRSYIPTRVIPILIYVREVRIHYSLVGRESIPDTFLYEFETNRSLLAKI